MDRQIQSRPVICKCNHLETVYAYSEAELVHLSFVASRHPCVSCQMASLTEIFAEFSKAISDVGDRWLHMKNVVRLYAENNPQRESEMAAEPAEKI